ncbi:MAG: cytochrome c nitrite reductase small subunit [Phycisphaerales bacterium]|nr:cytochrome c nitrite reductase small subunit [Phycisphaerales bacterium]
MKRKAKISLAGLGLSGLIGVLVGLSGYTFNYAEGTSYLSNDPRACVNCHIMREQYDGWQKSAHHAVATCNDCHVPHDFVGKYMAKVDHGYRHSKAFTLQDFHEPIRITPRDLTIVENNCVRCHEGVVGDIVGHAATVGETVSCVKCHASVGHGPRR